MSSKRRLNSEEDREFRKVYRRKIRKFIEKYLKIQTKDSRLINLRLNEAQLYVLNIILRLLEQKKPIRLVILKARQMGISTFIEAFIFAMARLRSDTNCLIVSHSKDSAKRIYRMAELFLDNLPPEVQPMVSSRTQSLVRFENPEETLRSQEPGLRSQIQIGTAKNLDLGASFTLHAVHASEVARKGWANPEATMLSIINAVPYLPGTFVAVESTAQGMGGYFYDLWNRSMSGDSEWTPVFIPWFIFREYELELSESERQHILSTLTEDEKKLVSEFSPVITPEKLAWRRKTIDIECQGKVNLFRQEYPSCLVYGTRVSTDRGILEIGSPDVSQAKTTESGKIEACGPTGKAPIWRAVTKQGRVLEGTSDHPVKLVSGEWRWLAELQPGDRIQLRPPMFASTPYRHEWHPIPGYTSYLDIDTKWARFLGYYLGDGYWANTTVGIACDAQDADIIDEVTAAVSGITGAAVYYKSVARIQGRKGCTYVNGSGGPPFREVMRELGVIVRSPMAKQSSGYFIKNLRVPECIWRSPKPIVKEFLSALFECDAGHRNGGACTVFYTKSQDFARDVQLLLLGFGINATVGKVIKKAGTGKVYTGYEVTMRRACTDLFNQEVGFRSKRKRERKPLTDDQKLRHGRTPNKAIMEDEVELVVSTGRVEDVYDLTIEGVHEFSANGIVTHNTSSEAFLSSGATVFEPEAIEYHSKFIRPGRRGRLVRDNSARKVRFIADPAGPLEIWKPPVPNEDYVIGGDPAQGMVKRRDGKAGDYAAAVVLSNHMEQVAELKAHLDPHEFADYLDMMGRFFNTALLYPEVSGYGGGYAVQHSLQETYPRIGVWRYWDKLGVKYSEHVGFSPDGKSVPILISKMVREVHRAAGILLPGEVSDKHEDSRPIEYRMSHSQRERQRMNCKLRVYSKNLCSEMASYIVRDTGEIGAAGDGKDDLVRALGLAVLALEQIPPPADQDPLMRQLGRMPAPEYDGRGISTHVTGAPDYPDWLDL